MVAAVGELEQEYGSRIDFNIVPPEETAEAADELELFGFTALQHGLVAFTAGGEALVKIPGHRFGREEIAAAIEAILAAN